MDNQNISNPSFNEIVRRRRLIFGILSSASGGFYGYFDSEGSLSEMAEMAFFYGPSVVQGTLEAFVNKAYIKNMLAALTSGKGKSYVVNVGVGAAMGPLLAAASNGLGYWIVRIGYDTSRYFSGYG